MENIIEIQNLRYEINNSTILDNISMKVGKGELVGLIGPNGAGKTTLLKCLNGINRSEGLIKVNGTSINRLSSKKLAGNVALMHQNTQIGFPFSAKEIVLMGRYPYLKRMKRESSEDRRIARKNMEYTDTVELEECSINEMSGGERQRVLFAKTLTQETGIILLDEPTASLDITYQEQIFKYSRELAEKGTTIIAAIHDLKIAAKYCTRLVLMNEGRIVAEGKPEEVLTSQNLSQVYCVNALVYKNRVTGLLDIYIHKFNEANRSVRFHVIGGGGSAAGVIRQLYEQGYYVSAGVFSQGDSDVSSAEVFGIDFLVEKPFCKISEELYNDNLLYIKNCHTTILCNMPFGMQNIKNLEAAEHAARLVIIEDDPPETRDFTNGKAIEIYNRLKGRAAAVIDSSRLHEVL
ncbi:MAG TPA: ABC transporter ATP-binding protein [Ruminiclostridium sp.]|nr:ABC transporter ATP-binding protein [Ruminiclostridium sp.]